MKKYNNINLYDWQKECLDKWFSNNCQGIINVATGAGKTILAVAAIKMLREKICQNKLKVKIIVPKIFLTKQWMHSLIENLGIKRDEIGIYYGQAKESETRRYMIYVINSARYSLSSHIISDYKNNYNVLLICDECHHYGSAENSKIFDFLPYISGGYYSLGLSATPKTDNPAVISGLGGEIYKYGFDAAIKKGIVADYDVFNISLGFTASESEEYLDLTNKLNNLIAKLNKIKPYLINYKNNKFYAELQNIAAAGEGAAADCASLILVTIYRRKEIIYLAENRISCAAELIKLLPEKKIIVFGERISAVDGLYAKLKNSGAAVGRYHSEMSTEARGIALERYKNGEINILLSCRALDEGLNVPDTDAGIIMSSTGSLRQRIQRIGRVLRKSGENLAKSIYYLYIGDTSEENKILPDNNLSRVFNLHYNAAENRYISKEYDSLCDSVLKQLAENKTPPDILDEVKNNFRLGVIRSDWRLSEPECRVKIDESKDNTEKNYWISMLKLAAELNQ
jgi:superfamily II DNA or RNA helicase